MSSQESKDITVSLATHLPKISTNMNIVISHLQITIEGQESNEEDVKNMVKVVIPQITKSITSIHKEIDITKTVIAGKTELYRKTLNSFSCILDGLSLIIMWLEASEEQSEDNIKTAINLLFEGSQKLLIVISEITEKEDI